MHNLQSPGTAAADTFSSGDIFGSTGPLTMHTVITMGTKKKQSKLKGGVPGINEAVEKHSFFDTVRYFTP
jgi:hypothetical protein